MGYNNPGPSNWFPPGSHPPVHGTVFGPNGQGPGYDAAMKIGNSGTPMEGHLLISDTFCYPNKKTTNYFDPTTSTDIIGQVGVSTGINIMVQEHNKIGVIYD